MSRQQDSLRPPHGALGPEQYGNKQIHLQHRNTDVTEKPGGGLQTWSSDDYSASLSAAAEGRNARFQQAASALSPYAADDDSSSHAHATGAHGAGHQVPHHGHFVSPAPKVGKPAISMDAYSGALQASAAAKQQRFDKAASASAPFAMDEQEVQVGRRPTAGAAHTLAPFATDDGQGSMAGGNRRTAPGGSRAAVDEGRGGMATGKPHSEGYHYHKPEHPEASGKVGAAPRDDEQCEEQRHQRAAAQDASRVRNRGTVGLLG